MTAPRWRICGLDTAPRRDDCPRVELHCTDEPAGFLPWFDWVERMDKTHVQQQCPGCDRWAVWVARPVPSTPEETPR